MMCDIMPTISEDPPEIQFGQNEETNFEQLMVNMLDERDKLMETLRETQDSLAMTRSKLNESHKEKERLMSHLESVLAQGDEQLIERLSGLDGINTDPATNVKTERGKNRVRILAEDFASMLKELHQAREQLLEKDEEIIELKAERCNTRLLLEHLECLVARHERSLRMTVVKRQAAVAGGVSSEVEVLKALKSLFEHHKALDEKVRERLRHAVERGNSLESDLDEAKDKIKQLEQENEEIRLRNLRRNRQDDGSPSQEARLHNGDGSRTMSNGPVTTSMEEHEEQLEEMHFLLDKRAKEVDRLTKECKDFKERSLGVEEDLRHSNKQVERASNQVQRLERDLDEAAAQKSDMEDRIVTLEKRYVRMQHEVTGLNDDNERLETELATKETELIQTEEKVRDLQEKLELSEQNLNQLLRKAEALPKIEEELAVRMAALTEAAEKQGTAEEQLTKLQTQVEELQAELKRAREREKMNEDHNNRLSATIDKLLTESNERLQAHLKERMTALEEKTAVTQELESMKAQVDELQKEKEILARELSRLTEEYEKLLQLQGGSNKDLERREVQSVGEASSLASSRVPYREQRGRQCVQENPSQVFTLNEQEWQKMEQANVLKNITLAFDTKNMPEFDESQEFYDDDGDSNEVAGDAQTLASLLQQQIDAINMELHFLQEEHRTTEEKTEELVKSASSTAGPHRLSAANEDYLANSTSSFPFPPLDPMDTTPIWVKSSKEGSLNNLNDDSPTPPTPSSLASDSTESPKTSIASPVPEGNTPIDPGNFTENSQLINNGMAKQRDNSNDSLPSAASTSTTSSAESLSKTGAAAAAASGKKKGLKGSFGRIFSGGKGKGKGKDGKNQDGDTASIDSSTSASGQRELDRGVKKKSHLLSEALAAGTPFALWNAPTVVAWLELWVGMPPWYVAACQANVKSGAIMSALSDTEIQHEIGITNPLHRLKLRLAIHEIVTLTTPSSPHTNNRNSLVYGEMNHEWVANQWLPQLGLPQYKSIFEECLVDARMLDHISKKEYQKCLKVVDSFHRHSIQCGVKCLSLLNYDKKHIEKMQQHSLDEMKDVLVWSNARVIKWLKTAGLEEYADNLQQSGIHGAVIALDEGFDHNALAYALQIPSQNTQIRQVLERNFACLLASGTDRTPTGEVSDISELKRSKSWRKMFKTKEKSKAKEKEKDKEPVRKNSTGSESSLSQCSTTSSPKSTPKVTKNTESRKGDPKSTDSGPSVKGKSC